jgi:hypothetical protein
MRFSKDTIRTGPAAIGVAAAAWAVAAAAWAGLAACSAAPARMECQEIEARLKYSDLSADQKRFAEDELADCEGRVRAAEAKDSAFIEGANDRFTPKDSAQDTAQAPR